MLCSTLLHDYRHNRVLVGSTPLFVHLHQLIDPNVAHQVTCNEYEIGGNDAMCVDIAHGIARGKRLLCCYYGGNPKTGVMFGPLRVSIGNEYLTLT